MHFLNLLLPLSSLLGLVACLPATNINAPTSDIGSADGGFWTGFPNVATNPSLGDPYCPDNRPQNADECILVTRMTGQNDHTVDIFLYDHNCVLLGGSKQPLLETGFSLTSQLPYTIDIDQVHGGQLGWHYAGRYFGTRQYNKYECYNTRPAGDDRNILPACQIYWDCSSNKP